MDASPPGRLADAIAAFLRNREATGCTAATLRTYSAGLEAFHRSVGVSDLTDLTPAVIEGSLTVLRARMKPISVHRHYRTLRTFLRWCHRTDRLAADPTRDLTMRAPKTLPRVPGDEDVRRLLAACDQTPEGRRNRALIGLLADSALRQRRGAAPAGR